MADDVRASGWTGQERAQRQAWLRLTPRQRLDWLWGAKSFALRALEARQRRVAAVAPPSAEGD